MGKIKEEDEGILLKWIDDYIERVVISHQPHISIYIEKLRQQNPGITAIELAKKVTSRKSFKNGLVGAATGVGGFITLPVSVPTDLIVSWKIQIYLALTIAHIFGHNSETTDISGQFLQRGIEETWY
jgi:hypothetical protein